MFQRPKTHFFPAIQTDLANDWQRKHLSAVPEVDTPATGRTFLTMPRPEKQRPVSEVTEIIETDDDDESEFEEDTEAIISFQSVCHAPSEPTPTLKC